MPYTSLPPFSLRSTEHIESGTMIFQHSALVVCCLINQILQTVLSVSAKCEMNYYTDGKMRIGSSVKFFQHTNAIIIKYLHTNHMLDEFKVLHLPQGKITHASASCHSVKKG